jgi:hypothetical protein
MTPMLSQYLNKNILVAIPALFEDGGCRPYLLLGVELNGLWLHSEDLTERLLRDDRLGYSETSPVIFVPFAQIAAVLVATKPAMSHKPTDASGRPAGTAKTPIAGGSAKRKK